VHGVRLGAARVDIDVDGDAFELAISEASLTATREPRSPASLLVGGIP
jgi:hypothetical protein